MNTTTKLFAAAAVIGIVGAAYAQTAQQGHGNMPMSDSMPMGTTDQPASMPMGSMDASAMQEMMQGLTPAPNDPASTKDFKAADMQMMHGMMVRYTGNPDVDFRTHMIPHHQGAINMAKVALVQAKSLEPKTMAQKIIDDQEREIAEMQAWLEANGR